MLACTQRKRTRKNRPLALLLLILIAASVLAVEPVLGQKDLVAAKQRAFQLRQEKDWPAAADAYREVVELEPNDPWSWYTLGAILQGMQDLDGAAEALEAALQHGLSAPGLAHYNLACIESRRGHREKAFEHLEPAAQSGIFEADRLRSDPDLESLRFDARFADLARQADLAHHPCEVLDDYKTLDFLLGTWDVFLGEGGPKAASTVFGKSAVGCAIQERWSSTLGGGFDTLSHYDAVRDRWVQTMVGSGGGSVAYEGGWKEGAVLLEGEAVTRSAAAPRSRRILTPLEEGRVRMVFENSTDGGKTWTAGLIGLAVRQADEN